MQIGGEMIGEAKKNVLSPQKSPNLVLITLFVFRGAWLETIIRDWSWSCEKLIVYRVFPILLARISKQKRSHAPFSAFYHPRRSLIYFLLQKVKTTPAGIKNKIGFLLNALCHACVIKLQKKTNQFPPDGQEVRRYHFDRKRSFVFYLFFFN